MDTGSRREEASRVCRHHDRGSRSARPVGCHYRLDAGGRHSAAIDPRGNQPDQAHRWDHGRWLTMCGINAPHDSRRRRRGGPGYPRPTFCASTWLTAFTPVSAAALTDRSPQPLAAATTIFREFIHHKIYDDQPVMSDFDQNGCIGVSTRTELSRSGGSDCTLMAVFGVHSRRRGGGIVYGHRFAKLWPNLFGFRKH